MNEMEKLTNATTKLINELTTQAVIIATVLVVLLIIYFLIRRAASDEDMNVQHWNKRISIAVFSYIGILVAGIIVGIINNYYGNLKNETHPTTTSSAYVENIEKTQGGYYERI